MSYYPTPDEQRLLDDTRARREQCACGETHEDGDGITPAVIARMNAYRAEHPGHQFAVDEEGGIVAVVIPRDPGPPEIIAHSTDLIELLDDIGAPTAADLS